MPDITLLTSEFDPFRGGIGTVVRELGLAATELGADITVVAPDYRGHADEADDLKLPFRVSRYRAGPYSGRQMPIYYRVALANAFRTRTSRLIAADGPFLEALALTQWAHWRPFDAILCGSEILRATKPPRSKLISARQVFGRPERLIAISHFTRDLLLENVPSVNKQNTLVAPLGVSATWFEGSKADNIREAMNLGEKKVIVVTGRITPRKGQLDLLRALRIASLPDDIKNALAVVFAGKAMPQDENYLNSLKKEAAALSPISVNIRDDLTDEELRALYATSDIFCLPGSAKTNAVEGFGLVFLEAAAQGLPAVAGRIGGVPEAVLNNQTGLLVAPDNPEELSRALVRLLTEPALQRKLAEGALAHAKKSTWQACAKVILGQSDGCAIA